MVTSMDKDINYYRMIQGTHGFDSLKEAEIEAVRRELVEDFDDTIDSGTSLVNGKAQQVLVENTTTENIKRVTAKPHEELLLGSIVTWRGNDFLVHLLDEVDSIATKGRMKQCNLHFNYVNSKGEIIRIVGVSEDATKYSSGIQYLNRNKTEDFKEMYVGEFQLKLLVPLTPDTVLIKRDDRIMLDAESHKDLMEAENIKPHIYSVTRRNVLTNTYNKGGYIEITISEDQYSSEIDNSELFVADFYKKQKLFSIVVDEKISGSVGNQHLLSPSLTKCKRLIKDAKFTFSSSDSTVASIDSNGQVVFNGIGKCILAIESGICSKHVSVTVGETFVLPLFSITPVSGSLTAKTGSLFQLESKILGELPESPSYKILTGEKHVEKSWKSKNMFYFKLFDTVESIGSELIIEFKLNSETQNVKLKIVGWV